MRVVPRNKCEAGILVGGANKMIDTTTKVVKNLLSTNKNTFKASKSVTSVAQ